MFREIARRASASVLLACASSMFACGAPTVAPTAPRTTTVTRTCRDGDLSACNHECEANNGESCFLLGAAHEEGKGVKKDERRAADLYRRACDFGFGTACGELAVLMLDGVVKGDPETVVALCTKGCEAKSAAACALLGSLHQEGLGTPADLTMAAKFYERACELGEAHGCSSLGYLYVDGRGVTRDEPKGRALIEKGCKGGDADACKVIQTGIEDSPAR